MATAIPGCDKGVFDNCDYGKGTFSMEAAADSVQESPQGTVTIPFFLKADDISCDDALLEVRVTAVST